MKGPTITQVAQAVAAYVFATGSRADVPDGVNPQAWELVDALPIVWDPTERAQHFWEDLREDLRRLRTIGSKGAIVKATGLTKAQAQAQKGLEEYMVVVLTPAETPKRKRKPRRRTKVKFGKFEGDPLDEQREMDIHLPERAGPKNPSGLMGRLVAHYEVDYAHATSRQWVAKLSHYEVELWDVGVEWHEQEAHERIEATSKEFPVKNGDWRAALREAKAYAIEAIEAEEIPKREEDERPGYFDGEQKACGPTGQPMLADDAAYTLPSEDTITIKVSKRQREIVEEYTDGCGGVYGPAGSGEERPLILKTMVTMNPYLAEYLADVVKDEIKEISWELESGTEETGLRLRLRPLNAVLEKLQAALSAHATVPPVSPAGRTALADVERFVTQLRTYMDLDDANKDQRLHFATREGGDMENDTPGAGDLDEARRVGRAVVKEFGKDVVSVEMDYYDEWVTLDITLKDT